MESQKPQNSGFIPVGTERDTLDKNAEGHRKAFHQDKQWSGKFRNGDATPSVLNVNCWECHSSVVTITNFKDGQDGQTIRLLGNPNTTIQHGSFIKTNTGANKVLVADKIYKFTMFNGVWYEDS